MKKPEIRRDEIINACEELYQTKSFKEITMKDISLKTTFTRTSIYNYFQTKEEIFLALFQREYECWICELQKIQESSFTKVEFCQALAHSLESRMTLLKLLSMNLYDMEDNSRFECLVSFKKVYGETLHEVENCLHQFFSDMTDEQVQNFIYSFFPFMCGIYPYTVVTEKQEQAMKEANVPFVQLSIYEITYNQVITLLKEMMS